MKYLILSILTSGLVFAGSSSNRYIPGQFLKNGSGIFAIPSVSTNDQLVGRATTDTLTNKTIDTGSNTITNLGSANLGGALTAGSLVMGNGSNISAAVATSGDVSLSSSGVFAYNNVVPINKGGTNNVGLAVTNGGVLYTDGTRVQNVGAGSANQVLMAGTPPAFTTLNAPTAQAFASTGSQTGMYFKFSSATYALGDTYQDGSSHVYTAIVACSSCTEGYFSGAGVYAGGNLTRVSGAGTATLTESAAATLATYTPSAGTRFARVIMVGGGGAGGGGGATGASQCSASNGGGGGATAVKWVTNFTGTVYYTVGAGGGAPSAGANAGNAGLPSAIVSAALGIIVGHGGAGGPGNAATSTVPITFGSASSSATATGGDLNFPGMSPTLASCISFATASAGAIGGAGGNSGMGMGAGGQPQMGTLAGSLYGGGGAGCGVTASASACAGAAGAAGLVSFEEFTQ